MAINDNTSYELYGSQVKDLANKIKNTVGGTDRFKNLIYMIGLTINEGNEIAAQIDDPNVDGVTVAQTCVYGFLRVKDGVWLDRLGVGTAITDGYRFISVNDPYFLGGGYDVSTIVKYEANWDENEEDCYPVFYLCGQTEKTPFGNARFTKIELGANSQTGLSSWYTPSESSWVREPGYIIQRMTPAEALEIANAINAEQGSTVVSSIEVKSDMIFTIRSTATGKIVKYGTVKNMLSRGYSNIVFLPEMARNTNYEIMSRATGTTSAQYFTLHDLESGGVTDYNLKNPSSYSSNKQYMWYIFESEDGGDGSIPAYGYDDDTATANAPESLFEVAYDSSDNLYMAVNDSSTSDWKQINNDAVTSTLATVATSGSYNDLSDKPTIPTVNDGTLTIQQNGTTKGTFTANQSTASTVNIETIYADTISPATAVDPITTGMIADGAVTAAKIDVSTVMAAIYPVGSIYMSATMSTAAQVEAAFGGTWAAWGAGRVPVGVDTYQTEFDTVEETGGAKTVTLTVDQIPSHDHGALNWADGFSGGSQAGYKTILEGNPVTNNVKTCKATGGGQSHNNLQPYITCYMYKRTA